MWVLAAFAGLVVLAYLVFFILDSLESRGANAFDLANMIGLITVVVGIVAAGMVLRRSSRP